MMRRHLAQLLRRRRLGIGSTGGLVVRRILFIKTTSETLHDVTEMKCHDDDR